MDRRSFFTKVGVAAAVALPLGHSGTSRVSEPETVPFGEEGYTYRWNTSKDESPTDDPRWSGDLPFGKEAEDIVITIDGEDVSNLMIMRLKTGKDGWISYLSGMATGRSHYFNAVRTGLVRFRIKNRFPLSFKG